MTRNTRLFSIKPIINGKKEEIIYRELNVLELSQLNNIHNKVIQAELAAQMSVTNKDHVNIPWPIKQQIGADVFVKSMSCVSDPEMKDIVISEFRNKEITDDPFLPDILVILKYFPGQSITDLLKLTHRDLIELVTICEKVTGNKIYGSGAKSQHLVNPKDLPDGGKSLQREIEKLNKQGTHR